MGNPTGENEHALRRVLDMTRWMSICILIIHFYYYVYSLFCRWGLTWSWIDNSINNLIATGLFRSPIVSKFLCVGLLAISMLGATGKKSEAANAKKARLFLLVGVLLFFGSDAILHLQLPNGLPEYYYLACMVFGYLSLLSGASVLSRIIVDKLGQGDIFNTDNETFPQQEQLIDNEFSINLPTTYKLKKLVRKGWINITNPFRGLLVMGTPGSGKTHFIIRHVIKQHVAKGFSMFIYDFKFDDLSVLAYNYFLEFQSRCPKGMQFYVIDFDSLSRSQRCNPLDSDAMNDITDAAESARTILLGLNREWIRRQGDFFVESPINFLTAIIWFLKRYKDGEFCSLPHVIELMQTDYDKLFSILRTVPEISALIDPFISAYLNGAMEQLEGQVAAAKISMARLSSPQLYFVMTGNELKLDINNPDSPKIVCMGNNPQKLQVYGAVLSLYVNRLIKLVNKRSQIKSSLIFDEFPTIYVNNIDYLIATARSNKVSTCLGIQDFSQLKKDYGKDQAEVIMNITGNIITGQVSGEAAKLMSERFGKTNQHRTSLTLNRTDTSISKSTQLEMTVPASKISRLSAGEFVGVVADDPASPVALKGFHGRIEQDRLVGKVVKPLFDLPIVRYVDSSIVSSNYEQVKRDAEDLVSDCLNTMMASPELSGLLVVKK